MKKEIPYWIALSQLPRWKRARMNDLIVKFYHDNKITIEDFFHLDENLWKTIYSLEASEITDLINAKTELASHAFLAEDLLNQGFEVIPITSPDYSPTLKANLKATFSPAVLYVKGNKDVMKESSLAIVGSRDASGIALQFTDNIARLASKESKVVVSGFAKGVDKQALDSAIKYKGRSIIVLPQGVLTFTSGYKTYYRQIVEGDVLVLSVFSPKAPWRAELAMARNPIIYGLAKEIYVAESGEKGGTWSGVIDGLRKERKIYVRQTTPGEKNANLLLIQKGAIAVDFDGKEILPSYQPPELFEQPLVIKETGVTSQMPELLERKIISTFNGFPLTAKEILNKLNLEWTSQKLTNILKRLPQIEIIKTKKPHQFKLKDNCEQLQRSLFD